MPKKKTLSEVLREELAACKLSYAEISRRTGIPRQSMMWFVDGTRKTLRLDTAEVLAEFFDLELVKKKGANRGKRND